MVDDVIADAGDGLGATFATDDIGGVHFPRTKLVHGADGTNDGDVSTANPLPVDLRSDNSGGIEVVQDTAADLNCTEASAADIKASVQIMDDWDESDRAKVNVIVGQAGIAAGTGVDGATVPRVTLATDIPLPAPGTAAASLGKAEDAAHTTGDTGVASLAVRKDALGTNAGTDGDYSSILTDANGQLKTVNQSLISTANSSAAPLGISGVFTGTSEDISNYAAVVISIFTDQDSATDGLSLEWSSDGTNWDHVQTHTITASTSFGVQSMGEDTYFRVVYTNGTTGQGAFRLNVIYKVTPSLGEVQQLDEVVDDNSDALLVRAVISGKKPDTTYTNIQATAGGNLKVSVEETDTSATGPSKVEDSAHSSGDVGVMSLAVRADTLATGVSADGDYDALKTNADGALWTHHAPNELDAGNSTTTPLGAGATFTGAGVSMLDSSAVGIILDASHDSAVDGMVFQFSSDNSNWDVTKTFTYTAADGGREFQFGSGVQYFRVVFTNGGTLQTHVRIQTTLLHSTPITTIHRLVDDVSPDRSATVHKSIILAQKGGGGPSAGDFIPVQATNGGNFKVSIDEFNESLPAGTNNIGDVDVLTMPGTAAEGAALPSAFVVVAGDDGTDTHPLQTNAGGDLKVTLDSEVVTVDLGVNNDVVAAGDVAHDAADSGNPVKTGSKAKNFDGTPPGTAVAEDDRVDDIADVYGRKFVETAHPNSWDVSVDYASAQTNATVKAAPGAGLKLYITDIFCSNGATAGNITLLDGSGGTVKWEIYPAINGGGAPTLKTPIALTANTLLAITSTTVTTHTLTITGYTAP